jgi:hypothetical protein
LLRHLNLVEYYCVDSILLILSLLTGSIYLAVRLLCYSRKQKTD